MAESDDSGERTEQPTEKRIQQARDQGNLPHSRELSNVIVLISGVLTLLTFNDRISMKVHLLFRNALDSASLVRIDSVNYLHVFGWQCLNFIFIFLPFFIVCFLASFISPIIMGSLRFSIQSLTPKLSKLNPLSGFKRIYSSEGIVELIKSLLRVTIVGLSAGLFIWHSLPLLLALLHQPLSVALRNGIHWVGQFLLCITGAMALLALVDVPYQRWNWVRKLKMTRDELRCEFRESEGSPELKGRIRQVQAQMSQRQMQDVPKADVVVVNPTHYAVALKYDPQKTQAPIVVAKGVDQIALRIREIGEKHQVTVISAPPLARRLYHDVPIGHAIPSRFYNIVAQILSYVYQLNHWTSGPKPQSPTLDYQELTGYFE